MEKRFLTLLLALGVGFFLVNHWFAAQAPSEPRTPTPELTAGLRDAAPAGTRAEEALYVLENAHQMLVFSNIGGALAEINLPLRSPSSPHSVVRPIGIDKHMQLREPYNDQFPDFPYAQIGSDGKPVERGPVLDHYYPLLRRNIMGKSQIVHLFPYAHYACNLISDDPQTSQAVYALKRFEKDLIEFELKEPHRRIVKTFRLAKDAPYCFDLEITVDGDARGLWVTSGIPDVEIIAGNYTPSLKYSMIKNRKPHTEPISLPKTSTSFSSIHPTWVSNSNGFFAIILNPTIEMGAGFRASLVAGEEVPTRLSVIDAAHNLYPAANYPGYQLQLPLPASQATTHMRIFAGPLEDDILKRVDAIYTNPTTKQNPSFIGALSYEGWFNFISEPFAKFLFILMKVFHSVTYSWGASIILITVVLRVMLYPLNAWSLRSTGKMQQIAPQVAAIQERYKKEPKRAQMEIVNLYREKGINPMMGCLPIVIQIPFLIGMYDLLKSTFELRGAPFIPGWITNLSAPDILFHWDTPIFFFGTSFHLLPVLLGAAMYMQQKISSPLPKDKTALSAQQKQQKTMGNVMTLVFTFMFYNFPSGLNLYWLSSMVLGIVQQRWMTKQHAGMAKSP